jgi:hypothetical protein
MADPVYKRITDLPSATLPLAGTDLIEVSQSGTSGKGLLSGIFGAGWFAKLTAAFTAFKAPDADHADDCDTIVGETPANLHDAGSLTGVINLARIPADLAGKNAATATTAAACSGNAATATTAAACSGNAASTTVVPNCGVFIGHVVPGDSSQTYACVFMSNAGAFLGISEVPGGYDAGSSVNAIFYIRKS